MPLKYILLKIYQKCFFFTLQSALGAMFAKERPSNETSPHDATPGIEIQTLNIPQVGKFCTWDCAGQSEYHVTHGMFLGSSNSIFLLVYDITAEKQHKQVSNPRIKPYFITIFVP